MGFWKGMKAVGKAISKKEQEAAEKPRLWNSSTKQIVVLGFIVIVAAYVGLFLLKYSLLAILHNQLLLDLESLQHL